MTMQPPPIDRRTIQDIIARTEALAQIYAGWQPSANGRPDTGQALIRIFARMVETVITRVNQVPHKNLLAFLDMIGTRILPPQPARVPLTFTLAASSPTDALVPARTQVIATPVAGDPGPVLFETEADLVVTRTQLVTVLTREPARDRYTDYTASVTAATAPPITAFRGEQPIVHRMFLGYDQLLSQDTAVDISLLFSPYSAAHPWLQRIAWSYWDGNVWQPLDPATVTTATLVAPPDLARGDVTLSAVPPIPPTTISNHTSNWLCATLTTPLPRGELLAGSEGAGSDLQQQGILPEAGFSVRETPFEDAVRRDVRQVVYPFGREQSFPFFYVASAIAFSKPGAQVTLTLAFDTTDPVQPSDDLVLAWEYWDGTAWKELGRSGSAAGADAAATTAGFADETNALTRDGIVRFVSPPDWTARDLFDTGRMYWLRLRIAQGSYATVGNNRPPAIRRLTLGYVWPLPQIDTIETQISIAKAGLLPDAAFSDQTPVDLTKDFLPFGPEPAFNATFYLASDEVFTKPGADVTLQIALTNPAAETGTPENGTPARPANDVRLRWEFWNGRQWELLGESGAGAQASPNGFVDRTNAFAATQTITFTCPDTLRPTSVNGVTHAWLRVRIVQGNYGRPASYSLVNPDDPAEGYLLIPASFRPPSIAALTLDYRYTSPSAAPDHILTENDFVLTDHSQVAGADESPITPFTPPVDTHPGLYLGFQRPAAESGFANQSTTLYFGVAEVLYGAETATTSATSEAASVVWEYWNGRDWIRLGTRDETRNLTRRGLLTFIGPQDLRRSREFDREAFWLRARWDRGSYSALPQLQRILTNTVWATHTLTIQDEELGSSNGEPGQVFRTTSAPVLPGQRIAVREPELPSADEQVPVGSGESGAIWVPWHEVLDFFASGPRSRHYVIDHLTGELRFGDGHSGMIPPRGRANIRATWYQTGGGAHGNRPADSITQLGSTVPYVDQVRNLEPAGGGADQESLEAVVRRGPRALRHRNRAVALSDYEDLAFAVTPAVARVKCLPADSDRETDIAGQHAGTVRLIIVPRSGANRPIPSLELLTRVQSALAARLLPTVDLQVHGPDWLEVTVIAEVAPVVPAAANDVQTAILARLAAFLHPLTGGTDGQGWEFGRRPYRSDLYALIEGTPGVSYVRRLEVETTGVVQPERFLVYSGNHRITMFSEAL